MAIREKLRPSDERSGNLCVGIITCFFCITVLVGSAFFVLYLVLPVSATTSWFPIAGIILISLPWLFWMLTCTYWVVAHGRCFGTREKAPIRAAKVAPAGGATATDIVADEGDVESPGGERRVRFGGATEMASDEGRGGGGGIGANGREVGMNKGESNDEGPSPASHESETPLSMSMS